MNTLNVSKCINMQDFAIFKSFIKEFSNSIKRKSKSLKQYIFHKAIMILYLSPQECALAGFGLERNEGSDLTMCLHSLCHVPKAAAQMIKGKGGTGLYSKNENCFLELLFCEILSVLIPNLFQFFQTSPIKASTGVPLYREAFYDPQPTASTSTGI